MFVGRFVLMALFRPMFWLLRGDMTWREIIFATAAGLRGSVSLILAQAVATDHTRAAYSGVEVTNDLGLLKTFSHQLSYLTSAGCCR